MKIWSGEVCLGDAGIPVDGTSFHTGDIIMLWHGDHIGTEHERWEPCDGLSAIVTDDKTGEHYPMGIRSCGFDDPTWDIRLVKKFSDVVAGERWPAYGFSYTAE